MLCRQDTVMATAERGHLLFSGSFSENSFLSFQPAHSQLSHLAEITAHADQFGRLPQPPRPSPLQLSPALIKAQFGSWKYYALQSSTLFVCLASGPLPCSKDRDPSAVGSPITKNIYVSLLFSSLDWNLLSP